MASDGGFHGRTTGALALTGQPAKREPFAPLLPDVEFVPYGDLAALAAAVTDRTAAVFLEPIQGWRTAVVLPPAGYLAAARELTREAGALLVLDEVQTGIGRTGVWFAHQHEGVEPDVVTLAKGLGGGLPLGACVAFGTAAGYLGPGSHGSTFGGNPVVRGRCVGGARHPRADGAVAARGAGRRPPRRRHRGPLVTRWCPTYAVVA